MYLKHCKKVVCIGHQRFLASNHPLRRSGMHCKDFNGEADHCTKPIHRNEAHIIEMVKDIEVIFGKDRVVNGDR